MGALIEKAPSPFVTNCDPGIAGRAQSMDLSGREGTYQVNKSEMYFGAKPLKALKVSGKILKSIRDVTGSQ